MRRPGKRGRVDEDFIHSVRSQLPIRGKHSDHCAAVEALAHERVGLAHVVLGLLREQERMAASILRKKGMYQEVVRQDIAVFLNEESE
jgi:hypothetical protein